MFFTVLGDSDLAFIRCLFDFCRTASHESYTFSTIFSQVTSKNALKTYHSVADVLEKVKKTSRDGLGGLRGSWQVLASRGQLWDLLGGLFIRNETPEGAGHRKTMLLTSEVSFFQKINPRRVLVTGKPCL